MNDILRLALVMNTNHSKFTDNLSNVIIFMLFINKEKDGGLTTTELQEEVKKNTGLVFTEKEIKNTINCAVKKNLINEISKEKFAVGEDGYKKIHCDYGNEFDNILNDYAKEYRLQGYDKNQIFDLVCEYLYSKLNENIEILMALVGRSEKYSPINIYINDQENYTDEQRKIINDFLDWNNVDKNKLLYNLVSFSVDYCRLTVKKNQSSFKNYFKGKIFYLDSNIIYRLMGINNENRKKTISEFIKRCQDVGVDIVYTNFTKQEVLDSLSYHVKKLKNILINIKASPDKLLKLFEYECDNELYIIYHKWSRENYSYGDLEAFESYLKDEFFSCVNEFRLENFTNQSIIDKDVFEKYTNSFASYKNYGKDEKKYITIQTDIQNILGIYKKRRRKQDGTSWNIKEYMISADHYFIKWAGDAFRGQAPYIVLPSVWYSIILKLDGRTEDDYKSYVEFMKIRYNQGVVNNAHEIIFNIAKTTTDAVLQDKIIDELVDGNSRNMHFDVYEDIPSLVQQAYDCVLDKTRNEGYDDGVTIGMQEGYIKGKDANQEEVYRKGEENGKIKGKLESINDEIKRIAYKKRIRNIFFTVIEFLLLAVAIIVLCNYVWKYLPDDKLDKFNTILVISGIGTAGFGMLIKTIWLPTDLHKLEDKERDKRKIEIEELQSKLD